MLKTLEAHKGAAGYDEDFFAGFQEQAQLLREGRFAELDMVNSIEEVESVGRSDKREIRSRLEVLLAHLLKWRFQPQACKGGGFSRSRNSADAWLTSSTTAQA